MEVLTNSSQQWSAQHEVVIWITLMELMKPLKHNEWRTCKAAFIASFQKYNKRMELEALGLDGSKYGVGRH